MKHFLIKILIFVVFFPFSSLAGGSYELVKVKSFKEITETQYELEVLPIKRPHSEQYLDPYMGLCEKFRVLGNYSWFYGLFVFPEDFSKDSHLAALKLLKQAQELDEPIYFGWLGSGFSRIDPSEPCVVQSRALRLYGPKSIVSLYKYP